jgi:hypothetical protein
MFDLLPEECLFIIIQHLLDDRSHFEQAQAVGNQSLQKNWKTVCKNPPNTTSPFNMKKRGHKMIGWEKAPFTRIIPLMKILPDVFNTNTMWTYILEKELRNGKRYKRKPKDAKLLFKTRVQEIIQKRYIPILVHEKEISKYSHNECIKHHKQMHIIQKALQSIKPQIQDISKLDDLDENDPLPPVLPITVKLPVGFIGRWSSPLQWECFYDMYQLNGETSFHQRTGNLYSKYYAQTKKNIHYFKKIINQVMEEEIV